MSIEKILARPFAERTAVERGQVIMFKLMQRLGFWGILLCASVPNPLFDLAGIMCGHFSIPFITFWGATFIGKALVKNTIQCMALIIIFSDGTRELVLGYVKEWAPSLYLLVSGVIDSQLKQFGKAQAGLNTNVSSFRFFFSSLPCYANIPYFKFLVQ